jgi:thiamine biosynthesis lipoprotein
VDEALKVLRTHGVSHALVAGGGDMAASDPPPGKKGWRIEVAPLDVTNAPPTRFVLIANAGLATSGDLFQHLEIDGKRYSHIVDPRTGVGLTERLQVTIVTRRATDTDSFATAVSVLGVERGMALVDSQPGMAAFILRKCGEATEIFSSRRWQKFQPRSP